MDAWKDLVKRMRTAFGLMLLSTASLLASRKAVGKGHAILAIICWTVGVFWFAWALREWPWGGDSRLGGKP